MSGECTVTPGYTYANEATAYTNTRANAQSNPTVVVGAGVITSRELAASANLVDPSTGSLFYEDFISSVGIANVFGAATFVSATSTGTVASAAGVAAHPGQVACTAGNNSAAYAWIRGQASSGAYVIGGGALYVEWDIKTPAALSDAGDNYTVYVGLANGASAGAEPTDGLYFTYNHGTNSGRWVGKTAAASSRTSVNSSTSFTVSTYFKLKAVANAAGTSVEFFINGTSIGTSSTNLPSAVMTPVMGVTKTANTSVDPVLTADYCKVGITFTTAR